MKAILFQIPMKAISLNSARITRMIRGRIVTHKSETAKRFYDEFGRYLLSLNKEMIQFRNAYDERTHAIYVDAYFYFNEEEFYTKKRTINSKIPDLDNCLKLSIDSIFKHLGINDKSIVSINALKIPTNGDARMVFRLSLGSFPILNVVQADSLDSQFPP